MAEWSWKQAVADQVLEVVRRNLSPHFSINDIYGQLPIFQQLFPRNRHVKEKVHQHLQRLRDDNFILFQGGGHYELNLQFHELECAAPNALPAGTTTPAAKQVLRTIRLATPFSLWKSRIARIDLSGMWPDCSAIGVKTLCGRPSPMATRSAAWRARRSGQHHSRLSEPPCDVRPRSNHYSSRHHARAPRGSRTSSTRPGDSR